MKFVRILKGRIKIYACMNMHIKFQNNYMLRSQRHKYVIAKADIVRRHMVYDKKKMQKIESVIINQDNDEDDDGIRMVIYKQTNIKQ